MIRQNDGLGPNQVSVHLSLKFSIQRCRHYVGPFRLAPTPYLDTTSQISSIQSGKLSRMESGNNAQRNFVRNRLVILTCLSAIRYAHQINTDTLMAERHALWKQTK